MLALAKYAIKVFVLHISIVKPLGESGKLQLTSDMAELEFGLSAFMSDGTSSKRGVHLENIGDEYRMLRAMRYITTWISNHARLTPKVQAIALPRELPACLAGVHNRLAAPHRAASHPRTLARTAAPYATRVARGGVRAMGGRAHRRGGMDAR